VSRAPGGFPALTSLAVTAESLSAASGIGIVPPLLACGAPWSLPGTAAAHAACTTHGPETESSGLAANRWWMLASSSI